MLRGGWEVIGVCPRCDLCVEVRLGRMKPETSLWEQTLRCPRWRCGSRMNVLGLPYQLRARDLRGWVNVTATKLPPIREKRR
jgi:hypothetical protein